jgi:hypothetical protein
MNLFLYIQMPISLGICDKSVQTVIQNQFIIQTLICSFYTDASYCQNHFIVSCVVVCEQPEHLQITMIKVKHN